MQHLSPHNKPGFHANFRACLFLKPPRNFWSVWACRRRRPRAAGIREEIRLHSPCFDPRDLQACPHEADRVNQVKELLATGFSRRRRMRARPLPMIVLPALPAARAHGPSRAHSIILMGFALRRRDFPCEGVLVQPGPVGQTTRRNHTALP